MTEEFPTPKFPKLYVHHVERHGFFVYADGSKSEVFHDIYMGTLILFEAFGNDKIDNDGFRRALFMVAQSKLPGPRVKHWKLKFGRDDSGNKKASKLTKKPTQEKPITHQVNPFKSLFDQTKKNGLTS